MNTPERTSISSASVNARRKEHGDNLPKLRHVVWPQMSKTPKGDSVSPSSTSSNTRNKEDRNGRYVTIKTNWSVHDVHTRSRIVELSQDALGPAKPEPEPEPN